MLKKQKKKRFVKQINFQRKNEMLKNDKHFRKHNETQLETINGIGTMNQML